MPKDWNTVSDSGSSSSEEQIENEQVEVSQKQSHKSKQSVSSTPKHETQSKKTIEEGRERPKFLSDEQLIEKIKSKQLDERRKIKIVNLKSEELLEKIKGHQLISYFKEIKIGDKPPFYIASFRTEDDLVAFIQEKIDNRYRFFLHPYIKTARDIEREEKYRQRREEEDKDRERYRDRERDRDRDRERQGVRDDAKKRTRNRPQYEGEEQEEGRQKERKRQSRSERIVQVKTQKVTEPKSYTKIEQPKSSSEFIKQPVEEKTQRKLTEENIQVKKAEEVPKQPSFEIEKNTIRIKSNQYSKRRIADEVFHKRIAQKWDRIKIYVKRDGLDKVYELAETIYAKIKYGLKAVPDENTRDQYIEVVLENNCHISPPSLQYTLLTENAKKSFEKLTTRNKYAIFDKFSIEDYIKEFKAHQKEICKLWKEWVIKAEGDNIPLLLKLCWKLRKELYLNVNIKVGVRSEVPFAVIEIQPESDKEKRPKPDTSVVNNYLTN